MRRRVFTPVRLELLPPVDRERRWQALLGREEALSVLGEAEPWRADITALLELARSLNDDNALAEAYSPPGEIWHECGYTRR